MQTILAEYKTHCESIGDIDEHLPTLAKYASECESVIELGVRGCVSSWAFCKGLAENSKDRKKIFFNDISPCNIDKLLGICPQVGIHATYQWINDLLVDTSSMETDLTFIDTWHIYAQLKRELEKYSKITKKYIIMHDTTVDEVDGETLREYGYNYQQAFGRATELAAETGIPRDEIMKGMWFGIQEFLANHPEWFIKDRFFNNNGLMVLARRQV